MAVANSMINLVMQYIELHCGVSGGWHTVDL